MLILLLATTGLLSGCTKLEATLPDGTTVAYSYWLQDKSLEIVTAQGDRYTFTTTSDPVVELAKINAALASKLAAGAVTP